MKSLKEFLTEAMGSRPELKSIKVGKDALMQEFGSSLKLVGQKKGDNGKGVIPNEPVYMAKVYEINGKYLVVSKSTRSDSLSYSAFSGKGGVAQGRANKSTGKEHPEFLELATGKSYNTWEKVIKALK